MLETIQEFFQSPEFTALFAAVVAWLSANLGTLIVFAIKFIKLKAQEIKEKATAEETIQQLTAAYEEKIGKLCEHIDGKLNDVEKHVVTKMAENEAIKQEQINSETHLLEEALKNAKETLKKVEE